MCGKVIFKENNEETQTIIGCAEQICFGLRETMCSLGINEFFAVVLPIPNEISATDSGLHLWNDTRHLLNWMLRMSCEHELNNAAPELHPHNELIPILFTGMRDKNKCVQSEAISVMIALISIAAEQGSESIAVIFQKLRDILSHEESADDGICDMLHNCAMCV